VSYRWGEFHSDRLRSSFEHRLEYFDEPSHGMVDSYFVGYINTQYALLRVTANSFNELGAP
jgi:hypothetical protein